MTTDGVEAERVPTIRLVLGRKLKELRLAAGMDRSQLKDLKLGTASTISRIEAGKVPVLPMRAVAMCRAYGADAPTTNEMESLAFRASEDTIFDDYSDVIPRWFSIYVQLEASANCIRAWQPDVMPGLLQTPETARAVFQAFLPALDERTIERSVAVREERQRAAFGRPEMRIIAVLGEGVLARKVGGAEVAARQLKHLRALNATDQATIKILTWSSGAHAAMVGQFSLLEFPDTNMTDVAYVESAAGAKYVDKARDLPEYHERFQSIYSQSVPLEEYTA